MKLIMIYSILFILPASVYASNLDFTSTKISNDSEFTLLITPDVDSVMNINIELVNSIPIVFKIYDFVYQDFAYSEALVELKVLDTFEFMYELDGTVDYTIVLTSSGESTIDLNITVSPKLLSNQNIAIMMFTLGLIMYRLKIFENEKIKYANI